MKVILARPRGVCAGVERAVNIVEIALERFGPPIYVRHEIVHNRHIVDDFRNRGVVFVEEVEEVPEGSVVIFSAHGVSPAVYAEAKRRDLTVIDSTCPLVSKVHHEVVRFARRGSHLILIGHEGHAEVAGTMGHAPDSMTLVSCVEEAERVAIPEGKDLYVVTQTTLSLDDAADILGVLKRRFPSLRMPSSDDICYATQNRQNAIKAIAGDVDLLLVVGSQNSSNARRLVEVAESRGVRGILIDDETDLTADLFENVRAVGLSSGASTPEILVQRVLARLRELGAREVETRETVQESMTFNLPPELQPVQRPASKV